MTRAMERLFAALLFLMLLTCGELWKKADSAKITCKICKQFVASFDRVSGCLDFQHDVFLVWLLAFELFSQTQTQGRSLGVVSCLGRAYTGKVL